MGCGSQLMTSGGIAAASPLSERLLRMAEREGDDGLRLQAHHSGWTTWESAGDPAKAREHADAGRLLYDPEKHASHRLVYGGHDPGVCAGYIGALAEWLLGYPEKALASIADALALAERIAHPFTLSLALTISSVVYLNRREPERALRQLEAAEALAAEQRLSLIYEPGMLRGAALLGQGAVDEAIARIREGVTNWTRLGRTLLLPYGLAFLAEGLARHGDRAAALAALREGLETADATGEHMWDAELHRLTGTVLLAENKLDEGQASLAASDPHRPSPTSEIAGIARRPRSRPAVGRAGPARRSPRPPRPGLRLVHRGLRHRRSERGKGAARRAGVSGAVAMDIAAWLQSLGLERYEPAFRDNDIDGGVLPNLTAEDLKDLGVVISVGHRRRLLDAIAALGAEAPAAAVTAAPRDAPASRRGRTPPADGDVLRSGRLDGAVDPV